MTAATQFARTAFLGAFLVLGSITTSPCAYAHATATAGDHVTETRWGTPGVASKVTHTVTIIATEIKYNLDHLTFKKGETVRFLFVNKGEQPHEFMIADAAEQAEHRKMMAEMSGTNMPVAHQHDEGNVVTAKPGETKELVWHFTKKGRFEFACNYIGHTESGMVGTIDVR